MPKRFKEILLSLSLDERSLGSKRTVIVFFGAFLLAFIFSSLKRMLN
jgi:hypothetical protein